MADLALEANEEQPSDEPGAAYTGDADGAGNAEVAAHPGVVALDGRYQVQPDQPLPELSTPNSRAFAVVDSSDTSQQLYALITDPKIPFRLNALGSARDLEDVSLVKPVQWGSIDWPLTERCETIIILQRPMGEPLMPSINEHITPLTVQEIADYLMNPMVDLLEALSDHGLAHRSIRPSNIFRTGSDGAYIAGEFYSAPPGFHQPSVFEPLERAMCEPGGRGAVEIADDLFALGVTALFLSIGRNPVAGVDDKTLLARRADMGSFAALTLEHKPPGDLALAIRSLLNDSPRERWTIEDLSRWSGIGAAAQAKPLSIARSDRGFDFAGGKYHTGRELALAFSQNWKAAIEVVQTDAVQRWAERGIETRDLSQQLDDCKFSDSDGPRMISDDLLLARTIITLDPDGPLRYRGLNVMPDGIGALSAFAAVDKDIGSKFSELLTLQLMQFWFDKQLRPAMWASAGKGDAEKMLAHLKKKGPGFGIERCVYEMNKGMACQSPRFTGTNAVAIRDMMEAIDAGCVSGEQQLDRHVAAFLGARYSGSLDNELDDFATASNGEEALVAQLGIFAAVQFKHGPRELPHLASLFFNHLETLLSPFHNVELRERIRRSAEQVATTGKLPELLSIVRNKKYMRMDKKGFGQSKLYYTSLERQIQVQQIALTRISPASLVKGRVAAAYIASCICATVVVMISLGGGVNMAKKKKKPVPVRQKGHRGGRGGLPLLLLAFCVIATMLLFVAAPALIVYLVGMVPTFVAIFIDRDPRKYASITVAAMNFSGVSFYLVDFLAGTASFSRALEMVSDVFVLAVIYGAAASGWILIMALPPVTAVILTALAESQVQSLRKEQSELVKNWGPEVSGRSLNEPLAS